jgi:hypothetical protein
MNTDPLTLPPNPTPEDLLRHGREYARRRNSANYRIRTKRQLAALERSRPVGTRSTASQNKCRQCGFPISPDSTHCGECLCEDDGI